MPALLPEVFEPFTQGNPALDRTQGGLGIGLYLVKNLVDLHGGTCHGGQRWPRSRRHLHGGLPLMQQQPARESDHLRAARGRVGGARRCSWWTTTPMVGTASWPCSTSMAIDGEAGRGWTGALEMAANDPPDVVLLDIGLPEWMAMRYVAGCAKQGLQACRHHRVDGLRPAGSRAARRSGFDNYVVKPCPLPELLRLPGRAPRRSLLTCPCKGRADRFPACPPVARCVMPGPS